ncbi:hypothetical protein H5410_014114 [Solanum commersonii]|uniref:MAR-binding protein n=1 Tax=Solanum commersonii TaxID=4109 RepID=A0A9J5ZQE8_SOLCO|nr:hypothetical protein H5410_014114 [Solanum commersonii]
MAVCIYGGFYRRKIPSITWVKKLRPNCKAADGDMVLKLKSFSKFEVENTSEALSVAMLLINSKPNKGLCKFLKAHCDGETLVVVDLKLGNTIKEKLTKNTSEKNDTDQKRKLVERDNIQKLNTKSCASQEENFKPYTLKNT